MGILYLADMHGKFPTLSPDLDKHNLVLLGDMVNNGTEYEYRKLGKWIESVKRPDRRIWVVRGNHDSGQLGNLVNDRALTIFDQLAWQTQTHTFADKKPQVVELDTGFMILLDSVARTISPHDYAQGEIGEPQLEELDSILSQLPPFTKTVVLHHDPLCADTTLLLKDAGRFIQTVQGRVDYVVYGHSHGETGCVSAGNTGYMKCGAVAEGAQAWLQDGRDWQMVRL